MLSARTLKRSIVLLSLLVSACSSAPPPPPVPDIAYSRGFFDSEQGADGSTWRWAGSEGIVTLRNMHRDMLLTIRTGTIRRPTQPPRVKIELNNRAVDEFAASPDPTEKEYVITAAMQGDADTSQLKITTDQSFVPHEADPGNADVRRLAIAIYSLSWRTQQQ